MPAEMCCAVSPSQDELELHEISASPTPTSSAPASSDDTTSLSFSDEEEEEDEQYILVKSSDIRKEVQCPICLGIIRKTRTVMECLHRFCRECIDKAMRLGNKECPACRKHCPSRRSLRDDPKYDALIAAIYPDLDRSEEEELTFHEEDKLRNRKIQANIAQTLQRQSEALAKRRTTVNVAAAAIVKKAHGKYHNVRNQKMGNGSKSKNKRSMFYDTEEDSAMKLSSSDEEEAESLCKRVKRSLCETSASGNDSSDRCEEMNQNNVMKDNCAEGVSRERGGYLNGINIKANGLVWGKAGARTNMRYGSLSNSHSKHGSKIRSAKMVDYLLSKARVEEESEFEIHLTLMPCRSKGKLPLLEKPHLCCRPTVTIMHLCKLLSLELQWPTNDIEIVLGKSGYPLECGKQENFYYSGETENEEADGQVNLVLKCEATLAEVFADCLQKRGNLVLMYRSKRGCDGSAVHSESEEFLCES